MSYEKPRIQLTDTPMSAIIKMAGGNPGAITILVEILKQAPEIDPQNALGGLGAILSLDTYDIYEERIWMLYKDVCKQDLVKMLACLRGCGLGFISERDLNRFIDNRENTFDLDDLLKKVKKRLKDFDTKAALTAMEG